MSSATIELEPTKVNVKSILDAVTEQLGPKQLALFIRSAGEFLDATGRARIAKDWAKAAG